VCALVHHRWQKGTLQVDKGASKICFFPTKKHVTFTSYALFFEVNIFFIKVTPFVFSVLSFSIKEEGLIEIQESSKSSVLITLDPMLKADLPTNAIEELLSKHK
jgi:hypothetical protein